jgi:hypothetical protein
MTLYDQQAAGTEESPVADAAQAAAQKDQQMEQAVEAQDNAPQSTLVAENLQATQEAAQFQIFGMTQEAINGAAHPLYCLQAMPSHVLMAACCNQSAHCCM